MFYRIQQFMERIYSNIVGYNSLRSEYIFQIFCRIQRFEERMYSDILQYTTVYGTDIFQIYRRIQQFMERIYSRYIVGYNSLWSGYILVILQDTTVYGADIFYARYLRKQNFVLWASNSDTPDFGGKVGIYKVTQRGVYSSEIHLPPFFKSNLIFFGF